MLIILIVLTGIMAGIYFSFSVFMMKALNQMPALLAAQVMNEVNDVIVNTLFLPLFFGTTLWLAGLAVWEISQWNPQTSPRVVTGSGLYIIGMFLVTAFGNVPLNNKLKSLENNDVALMEYWDTYHRDWLKLNHLRTITCVITTALLAASAV